MSNKGKKLVTKTTDEETITSSSVCGIVMPISDIDGCTSEHWKDVLNILHEAITNANLEPKLVSVSNESSIIQKTIVQNLYENEIVICDVSGKNPNVMFELGMRLAFDKPTIIVKDNETDFSFDTSVIEHLLYPRSLHYQSMVEFKELLTEKITATLKAAQKEDYSTFLKHFGTYKSASITSEILPEGKLILKRLDEVEAKINANSLSKFISTVVDQKNQLCVKGVEVNVKKFIMKMKSIFSLKKADITEVNDKHFHISTDKSLIDNEQELKILAKKSGISLNWVR